MNKTITQLSQFFGLGLAMSLKYCTLPNWLNAAPSQSTNEFTTFAEWCLNQNNLSEGTQHTIQILLQQVNTKNCQPASQSHE